MWDQKYSATEYIFGTEPNEFLQANAGLIPAANNGGKVLCLAEGEGRNAVFLAKQGYAVTAVDSSSVGLDKARQLAEQQGLEIELIHADLNDYQIEANHWQGIVSIFCHLPPALRQRIHAEAVLGLAREQGVLILEAYRPKQLEFATGGPPVAELMMTKASLQAELIGLTFSHLQELDRAVIEGTHHHGMGAVVQAIGVREAG